MNPADLDVSLITPDGTRVSWMGGRSDVDVARLDLDDARGAGDPHGSAAATTSIEISRADGATGTVRGTLDVSVLGQKRSLPFELTGTHVDGRPGRVTLTSHLEPIPRMMR